MAGKALRLLRRPERSDLDREKSRERLISGDAVLKPQQVSIVCSTGHIGECV